MNSISLGAEKPAQQSRWINGAKGVAIIAVVVDHTIVFLYSSESIQTLSFFSVSLFVLMAGINNYSSMQRRKIDGYDIQYVGTRLRKLLLGYAVATLVTLIYVHHFFDLATFLQSLVGFSAQPAYYFIFFFSQLMVIAPILYMAVTAVGKSRYALFKLIVFLAILYVLSCVFVRYTFMLPIHGGGRYLFGGTYLFLFGLGMVLGSSGLLEKKVPVAFPFVLAAGLVLYIVFVLLSESASSMLNLLTPGMELNPPGLVLMVYSLMVLALIWSSYQVFGHRKFSVILRPVEWCGKYSLVIFFYHSLVITFLKQWRSIFEGDAIVARTVKVLMMLVILAVPVLAKMLVDKLKRVLHDKLWCQKAPE